MLVMSLADYHIKPLISGVQADDVSSCIPFLTAYNEGQVGDVATCHVYHI